MKHIIVADTGRFNISEYRGYNYFHHWTGHSVAVLPIILKDASLADARGVDDAQAISGPIRDGLLRPDRDFYGLRMEDLPCWQADQDQDDLQWTCVTGGVDLKDLGQGQGCDAAIAAMLRELREEMGLELIDYSFYKEGPMHNGKGSNLRVTNFIVEIRSARFVEIKPDSEFEARAKNFWLKKEDCVRKFKLFDLHTRNLLRMAKAAPGA